MTRGRKPKHPVPAWLKNPPAHIVERRESPEGVKKLAEQKKICKESSNTWRELRRQGVTLEYLEALDSSDPEFMDADKILTWPESKIKYAEAFSKIDEAKERNANSQKEGAESTYQNSFDHHQRIVDAFPDEIKKFKGGIRTATHTARVMLRKPNIDWGKLWSKAQAPCLKTLTNMLKSLEKATP